MSRPKQFILPTSQILRDFAIYAPIFSFYEGEFRGVVRDAVLFNTGLRESDLDNYVGSAYSPNSPLTFSVGLLDYILHQYEGYVFEREQAPRPDTIDHDLHGRVMDLVVVAVDRAVEAMMRSVLGSGYYKVLQQPNAFRWHHEDLEVWIEFKDLP